MAIKFTKDSTDGTVVFDIREFLPQPFSAPGWTDLRIGFLASITDITDPDDPTVDLTEEIGTPPRPILGTFDRYFIGVTDRATLSTFIGFSNSGRLAHGRSIGTSKLVSSDGGIGTSNSNFWRPTNEMSDNYALQIIDGENTRAMGADGSQIHFAQDTVGAGGYATLITLRLQRDNAQGRAKVISVSTKRDVVNHSGDVLFTDAPTEDLLETHLQSFSETTQTLGPVELSQEPSVIYVYWPFHDSRIRLHCHGILKAG